MAAKKKPKIKAKDLEGFKYFKRFRKMFEKLKQLPSHRNRILQYQDYVMVVLFYFFNPLIDSLRGIQQVTEFEEVRKALGIKRMSLGSLSESVRVFEPSLLEEIFKEIAASQPPQKQDPRLQEINQVLSAVDGSILAALPRMAWALWLGDRGKGARVHVQFEFEKDTAVDVDVTAGKWSCFLEC